MDRNVLPGIPFQVHLGTVATATQPQAKITALRATAGAMIPGATSTKTGATRGLVLQFSQTSSKLLSNWGTATIFVVL